MNSSTLFSRCFLCIVLVVLFANCQSKTSQTHQKEAAESAVNSLLAPADSLPPEQVFADLKQPATGQNNTETLSC